MLGNYIEEMEVETVTAESGVEDQPLTEEKTVKGAINRMNDCFNQRRGDIFIGLEGGLCEIGSRYYIVAAAAITNGEGVYVGVSSKLELPCEVSQAVAEGKNFGDEIRAYADKNKDRKMKYILESLITRKDAFYEAIRNAYLAFDNRQYFG